MLIYVAVSPLTYLLRVRASNRISSNLYTLGVRSSYTGYTLNLVCNLTLPLKLGDILRVAWISAQSKVAIQAVLAVVTIERIFDLFSIVLISSVYFDKFPKMVALALIFFILLISLTSISKKACDKIAYTRKNRKEKQLTYGKFVTLVYIFHRYLSSCIRPELIFSFIEIFIYWALNLTLIGFLGKSYLIDYLHWNVYANQTPIVFTAFFMMKSTRILFLLATPLFILNLTSFFFSRGNFDLVKKFTLIKGNNKKPGAFHNWFPYSLLDRDIDLSKIFKRKLFGDKSSTIQELKGGSGAVLFALESDSKTEHKIIKAQFGLDHQRLSDQVEYMRKNQNLWSFPQIFSLEVTDRQSVVEMEYLKHSIPLHRFLERNPERVEEVVRVLFDRVGRNDQLIPRLDLSLRSPSIAAFWDKKIPDALREIRTLAPEFSSQGELQINGEYMSNIEETFGILYEHRDKLSPKVLAQHCHGDLTFQNILVLEQQTGPLELRFIDPNPNQLINTVHVDFGKLLQSAKFHYEYIFEGKGFVKYDFAKIDYSLQLPTHLAQVGNLIELEIDLYGEDALLLSMCSAYCHLIRMLPYRIREERNVYPIYYAKTLEAGKSLVAKLQNVTK